MPIGLPDDSPDAPIGLAAPATYPLFTPPVGMPTLSPDGYFGASQNDIPPGWNRLPTDAEAGYATQMDFYYGTTVRP